MSEPVLYRADREARRRALDPERSFIVEAPAGSGKTELLIQRYLLLLARVEKPESVLAVTFTRKAAAEMQARVLRALERAEGEEPDSGHEQTTYRLAKAVREQDDSRGWDLIDNPSRLAIRTIDGLATFIVSRMPWVSRMGPLPSPDGAVDDLYDRAAIRTLDDAHSGSGTEAGAVARLVGHLDNDTGSVVQLLSAMLASRDQWLRHVTTGALASERFRQDLDEALSGIVSGHLQSLRDAFPEHLRAETAALAGRASERARPDSRIAGLRGLADLPANDAIDQWRALAELFLRRDGKRRGQLTIREGFGRNDVEEKRRFSDLDPGAAFLEKLHAVRSLPSPAIGNDQWEVLSALGVLLPRAVAELHGLFAESGRVDFIEVGLAAAQALGSPDAPSALAFAMDCRIEHLLVDEFQDTSESQYELLSRLTREWDASDRRTLFLVGDPMQSIYRFRKADVALFLRAQRHGFGAVELESLTLRVNFRSTPDVVDWVNRVVGPAFPASPDPVTGAVAYTASTTHAGGGHSGNAVTIHPILSRNDEREAEIVHGVIRDTLRDPERTVAVLVRSRAHAARISATLRSGGVRFHAVDMNPLWRQPVVRDLSMLTRALVHEADRIAWLAILRAPWCGLTLEDLFRLTGNSPTRTIPSLIADSARMAVLGADAFERLDRVRPVLLEALGKRGTLPLRRWVEGAWLELGGPAGLADGNAFRDAEAYLELLEQHDEGGEIRDWARFEGAVLNLFARPDTGAPTNSRGEARVQVLTIHKAKGLEFDTVILPGLGRVTAPDRTRLVEWLEFVDPAGRPRLVAAPVNAAGSARDALLRFVSGIQKRRVHNEETRLLYVAATRARRSIHLIGHVEVNRRTGSPLSPDPRSALSRLWKGVGRAFVEAGRDSGPVRTPEAAPMPVPITRVPVGWVQPDPGAAFPIADQVEKALLPVFDRPSFDWAGDLQRRVGIVVHRMLERLARGPLDLARLPIPAALAAEGLSGPRLVEAVRAVETALGRTIRDPRGRWILGKRAEADSELALSGQLDGVIRRIVIDRTFVEDGIRWIVDFKSGAHEGAGRERFLDNEVDRYRTQMELYARMVRGMDPRPIRIGLYFPMFGGWREWRFTEEDREDHGRETVSGAVAVRG